MPTRKWCFVPGCTNTTHRTPEKIFITVPKDAKKRRKWFAAARRAIADVSEKSTLYCCEDHLNLEEDMDNYIEYKLSKVNARLKPNVVPHLFACQSDKQTSRKRILLRESSEKRARKKIVAELMHKKCIEVGEDMSILPGGTYNDGEPLVFPSTSNFVGKREVACQTKIVYFRSKATQVDIKPNKEDAATTPLKFTVPDSKIMDKTVKKRLDFAGT